MDGLTTAGTAGCQCSWRLFKATKKPVGLAGAWGTLPHARGAETLLVRTVLRTVLTDRNTSTILAEANDFPWDGTTRKHQPVSRGAQELVEDLKDLLLSPDRIRESTELLGKFKGEIQIHDTRAVIRHTIPPAEDSPMAAMCRQDIKLPEDMVI